MKIVVQPQIWDQQKISGAAADALIDAGNNWLYASFLLVAAAIGGRISIKGLDLFEAAPEKRILEALQSNACHLSIRASFVSVAYGTRAAFQFDLKESPQLYLPLIILGAHSNGTSVLSSIQYAIDLDETQWQHRIAVLQSLGIGLHVQDDLLIIKGNSQLNTNTIHHSGDGTLLAALALCSLNAPEAVSINNAHLIQLLFPGFIDHLNLLLTQPIEIAE